MLPHDHAPLCDRNRIEVAKALGYSETCFVSSIRSPAAGRCDVSLRYFTPVAEVELCGHATIACIGMLHERGLLNGARRGTLHTRAGAVAYEIRPAAAPVRAQSSGSTFETVALTAGATAQRAEYNVFM